jgi:hypothetical protein
VKTLLAITLATALTTPASAGPRSYGDYAPLHDCKQVLRNYEKGNPAWRYELNWLLGFIDGASVEAGINVNEFLEDGGPVIPALIFCKETHCCRARIIEKI